MKTALTICAIALIPFSCQKKISETLKKETAIRDSGPAARHTGSTTIASGDTSQNALDWAGTYETTVPCADCPGIKTTLTLHNNNTFRITEEYLEKNTTNQDQGTFTWNKQGNTIALHGKNVTYKYKVGENKLIQLDLKGNEITGQFQDRFIYQKK